MSLPFFYVHMIFANTLYKVSWAQDSKASCFSSSQPKIRSCFSPLMHQWCGPMLSCSARGLPHFQPRSLDLSLLPRRIWQQRTSEKRIAFTTNAAWTNFYDRSFLTQKREKSFGSKRCLIISFCCSLLGLSPFFFNALSTYFRRVFLYHDFTDPIFSVLVQLEK